MTDELIQFLTRSKAFHSQIGKQSLVFKSQFLSTLKRSLTFKHSANAEIDLEAIGSKIFKDFVV